MGLDEPAGGSPTPRFAAPPVILTSRYDAADVRRLRATGGLVRLRRGAYMAPPVSPGSETSQAEARARARVTAVRSQLRIPFWFSHESAALIWGCCVHPAPTRTHITQEGRPNRLGDPLLVRHHGALPPEDRLDVDGLPVTSLPRTVIDCTTSMAAVSAIVVADSALRLGVDAATVWERLEQGPGRRGMRTARRVLTWADGRAESPGESVTRWTLLAGGVTELDPQVPVATRLGLFWLDLALRGCQVAIEFDGFVKYAGGYGAAPRVLFEEKRRQDALEEEGWVFVRVTWSDLRQREAVVARVRAAARRAPRR